MRVSNNNMAYGFLTSLNKSQQRQAQLNEQLSDGKAIHRPSDDPIRVIRSMRFQANLEQNDQFTQHVKDAQSWMDTSDSAIQNLDSLVIRAKELVTQAIGPNPAIGFQAAAEEIDGLINSAVDLGNTKIGSRYVFAGQMDTTQPFTRNSDGTVTFNGDNNPVSMKITPGAVTPDNDAINTTASSVFGSNMELFNQLNDIKNQLATGNPDLQDLSNNGLAKLETIENRVIAAHTELGARMSNYEMMQNVLEGNDAIITSDLSAAEDLNVPRAIIDFKTAESVYRTALSVGARIMPTSLVDFLR